ncbi:MAG: putative membrane protein YfcA, partial [Granulosicoccus sp.]
DPAVFMSLVPYLILLATCLFAFGKSLNTGLRRLAGESASKNLVYFALFLFSIYGGYFGAGLGIILLAIAQIIGYTEFHTANSIKNLLATSFTIISIVIFGLGGLIAWPEAVTMMLGSTVGGYIGGRYARRVNERYLSVVVVVFGLCLSMVYFYRS